jgi:hypothetical protein
MPLVMWLQIQYHFQWKHIRGLNLILHKPGLVGREVVQEEYLETELILLGC